MPNDEALHLPDHESDPARTPGLGWVGEGGASHLGPATSIESGRPEREDDAAAGDDGERAGERAGDHADDESGGDGAGAGHGVGSAVEDATGHGADRE